MFACVGGLCSSSLSCVDAVCGGACCVDWSPIAGAVLQVGASLKAFELLDRDLSLIEKLRAHTHLFRDRLGAAGFEVKGARYVFSTSLFIGHSCPTPLICVVCVCAF
jgi:hypothetical protein